MLYNIYRPDQFSDVLGQPASIGLRNFVKAKKVPHALLFSGPRGTGKCLGKGTKVLMYNGSLKKVENIKIGDLLMGADSTPRKVLSLARGREKMYWIRQNKGVDYRVNESHILSLKIRPQARKWRADWSDKEVLNISVREALDLPKSYLRYGHVLGYKVPIGAEETNLPLEPYFLGLWLGDGSKDGCVITNPDEEIQAYLFDYAERLGLSVTIQDSGGTRCLSFSIVNTKGNWQNKWSPTKELRRLNLIGNKCIPKIYLINSERNRLQLLAGILDTDGYCNRGVGYEVTQKSKKLARQIKFLADSLGFRTSITSRIAKIREIGYECVVWRVQIYGDVAKIPLLVERKKAKEGVHRVDWRLTGIRIEYDKVDDYYGFELDGDGLFLLEDCTVTHNTTLARIFATAINCRKPVGGEPCRTCVACKSSPYLELSADMVNDEKEFKRLQSYLKGVPKFRYQVVILDEAQALNKNFQTKNFLKLLEEPPKKSVIIMATTNPESLTEAITSRCSWWPVRGIAINLIEDRIKQISIEHKIKISLGAVHLLAEEARGSLRDALSLLESFTSYNRPISESLVRDILSGANTKKLLACIVDNKPLLDWLEEADNLCGMYSVKAILHELSKRLQDYGRSLMIEGDDSGHTFMQIAVALSERSREKVIDELTHAQLTMIQVHSLLNGKIMDESDPMLWSKFLISVPVGVEASIYPKSVLAESNLLNNVRVKGNVIIYQHFLNEEVSSDLKRAFAEFSGNEYQWRVINGKSTDKRDGRGKQNSASSSKRKQR